MEEFILNPRRAPRVAARCEARASLDGGVFTAPTESIGPRGCQLVAPLRFTVGDAIPLHLSNERVAFELEVKGRVVWAGARPPFRIGIEFVEGLPEAERYFVALLAAYPALDRSAAPDRIPASCTIHLGHAPHVDPELAPAEAALLREIGPGATVKALRDRLGPRFPASLGLVFALLGRQILVLDRARAGPPGAWDPYLKR